MTNFFTAHPASVGETYGDHLRFALSFGSRMALGGLAAIVHAVLPFLFVTTASRALEDLNAMREGAGRARAG
ncbi:MAG TPA: DUF6356 family protein [Casimicrobiaceae bacterium]|nr:DUF6356 family protein [Casimicrobiaceae bacterium]